MDKILNLLDEKNHYLEKFYKLNEIELINLSGQNYENIEIFYAAREGLLRMINKIDDMVDEQIQFNEIEIKSLSGIYKKKLLASLSYKTDVVNLILAQDLEIISYVERAKSELINELTKVSKEKSLSRSLKGASL